jgi:hypothetical protein
MAVIGEHTNMKTLWILAAAATLAACHNRSEDEVGAAPDRGDTTAVVTDTTRVDTTGGVTGQPSDSAVMPDTTAAMPDTTQYPAAPGDVTDTTGAVPPPAAQPSPTDTSTIAPDTSTYQPGAGADTTSQPGAAYDTTAAPGVTPDTGMGQPPTLPSDSAATSPSP